MVHVNWQTATASKDISSYHAIQMPQTLHIKCTSPHKMYTHLHIRTYTHTNTWSRMCCGQAKPISMNLKKIWHSVSVVKWWRRRPRLVHNKMATYTQKTQHSVDCMRCEWIPWNHLHMSDVMWLFYLKHLTYKMGSSTKSKIQ